MDHQLTLARHLLQIKAIKLSPQKPFTWASGLKSPIYCDNRIALSHPLVRRSIRDGFTALLSQINPVDGIAGVATAGIPHGAILADRTDHPFIYVRSKPKAHGKQNLIEGDLKSGAHYVVIEDLISTGGSSLQAVRALRDAGAQVVATMAIFTYGLPKATEAFQQADCPLFTLTHYDALIEVAQSEGLVHESDMQMLLNWRKNPQTWSEQHA